MSFFWRAWPTGAAIGLQDDFDGAVLRRLARATKSANQSRRLLALAQICDEGRWREAAKLGSVTPQIVRDWVVRFNADGPDGLLDGKAPGKRPLLDDAQRQALTEGSENSGKACKFTVDSGFCHEARAR
jgi:Winged helix-turn helix